jgi:hypothetical protein
MLDVLMPTGYAADMRTTLTLDDDVAMLLKKMMDESGETFRDVVNRVLRVGLVGVAPSSETLQIPQPRSMGGARLDLDQALSLAEGLNDNILIEQLRG